MARPSDADAEWTKGGSVSAQTLQAVDHLIQILAPSTGDAGDLRANLKRIVEAAYNAFTPDLCAILAVNPVTEQFILRLEFAGELRQVAQKIQEPPRPSGITQEVLREGAVFVEDIADYPHLRSEFVESEGIRAF